MKTKETRRLHDMTRARLGRARRLYRRLIVKGLVFGGDEMLLNCVHRAKVAGLYAKATYGRDVAWMFVRSAYHAQETLPGPFNAWMEKHFPKFESHNARYNQRLVAA